MAFQSFWLLPLLFMWHDFEELVVVPTWLAHHDPHIGRRTLFGGVARADILAVGIWEEFCLLLLIVAGAYWWHLPVLVMAASFPYLGHLVLHLVFVVIKHSYVPGVVTAVIELPLMSWYVMKLSESLSLNWVAWLVMIVSGFGFFGGNLVLIHWGMPRLKLIM